jgi:serine phosphatase RsbU (regulator of sigma subunit)
MRSIEDLNRRIIRVESLLVILSVAAITYADYHDGKNNSLGYLYLIPLSYSVLIHRIRTTLLLMAVCLFLRDLFGPIQLSPWLLILRDFVLAGIFLGVVWVLRRLGVYRREFLSRALAQRDELATEVALAAEVQQHLLGTHVAPDAPYDIAAKTWPAKAVGGDYYDFIDLGDGRLSMVIADISGKGLPAAMLMPAAQISLRTLASGGKEVDVIIKEFNKVLFQATDRARYATLLYATLDQGTGRIRYINAGHVPGLLLRGSDREVEKLETGGPPVGLFPDASYTIGETRLGEGDLLILYTDGLTDAENCDAESFGDGHLMEFVRSLPDTPSETVVQSIYDSLARFTCGPTLPDDLTIIAIKIPGLPKTQPK